LTSFSLTVIYGEEVGGGHGRRRRMDIEGFTAGIGLVKTAVETYRAIIQKLPKSPKRDEIEKQLQEAENQFRAAEARAAKSLGFDLCQCDWPPPIMLKVGGSGPDIITECPRCKHRMGDDPPLSDDWQDCP